MAEEKDKNELIQDLVKKNQLLEAKVSDLIDRMN